MSNLTNWNNHVGYAKTSRLPVCHREEREAIRRDFDCALVSLMPWTKARCPGLFKNCMRIPWSSVGKPKKFSNPSLHACITGKVQRRRIISVLNQLQRLLLRKIPSCPEHLRQSKQLQSPKVMFGALVHLYYRVDLRTDTKVSVLELQGRSRGIHISASRKSRHIFYAS